MACFSTILPLPLCTTILPNAVMGYLNRLAACVAARFSRRTMFATTLSKLSLIGLVSGICSNQHQVWDFKMAWRGDLHHDGRSLSGQKPLSVVRWNGMGVMYPRA